MKVLGFNLEAHGFGLGAMRDHFCGGGDRDASGHVTPGHSMYSLLFKPTGLGILVGKCWQIKCTYTTTIECCLGLHVMV